MSRSKQTQISDELMQYETLSPPLKTMVRFLAANMDFCRQNTLRTCIDHLDAEWYNSREWTAKTVKTHVDLLLEKGLIVKTAKGISCSESIRMDVIHDMVLTDEFYAPAAVIRNIIPIHKGYHGRLEFKNFKEAIREILFTVFAGDADETLNEIANRSYSLFPLEYRDNNPFLLLFNSPFNPVIMNQMEPSIRFGVLNHIAQASVRKLAPAREALEYYQLCASEKAAGNSLTGIMLAGFIQGNTSRIKNILEAFNPSDLYDALPGWLEFITGNNDLALSHFTACIEKIRKTTKKRVLHIKGVPGLCHLLALLKSGDNENFNLALARINSAKKSKNTDLSDIAMCAFEPLFQDGLPAGDHDELIFYAGADPLISFIMMLVHTWLDKEKAKRYIPLLEKLRDKAHKSEYLWLAAEMSALLAILGKAPVNNRKRAEKLHALCGTVTCVDIVREEAKWEKTLRALINIGRNPAEQSAANDAGQRLVWLLDHEKSSNSCDFVPRLQKKTKKGEWTRGRAVAMKTLYNEYDTMPGLTDQDRRVASTISESYYSSGYGYYGRSIEYHFDDSKALPALAGHPLLFLEESPGIKAELVMGEPEVRFIRKRGKIELKMTPLPNPHYPQEIMVVADTPTRFKMVRIEESHRRIATLVGKGTTLPKEAESMARKAVESLSSMVTIHSDFAGSGNVVDVAADPKPHLHLMPFQEGVRIDFLVKPFDSGGASFKPGKGGKNVLSGIGGKKIQAVRDLKMEKELAEKVLLSCPTLSDLGGQEWEFVTDDPEESLEMLMELKACEAAHVMEWPQGEKLKVRKETGFDSLSLKIKKDRDWFKATGALEIDKDLSLDLKKLLEMLDSSTGRFVPLDDGTFLAITFELKKRLEELRAFSAGHGKGVRLPPLSAPALEGLTENLTSLETDKAWKDHCKRLNEVIQPKIPGTLQAKLRDYQVEGFNWLAQLAHWGVGGCLADDMGLGKTVQAIAAVLLGASKGPSLVVAPLSVMANWQDECRRFAPTLNVIFFGPGDRQEVLNDLGPFDMLVSSYGLLQVEAEKLAGVKWQTVILDEAQAIKNMKTKRSRAAMNLSAENRIITTGTPVENHLDELWTLFNFLNPGLLGSFKRFNEVFAVPIERDRDREARERLRKLIRPFILRRLKSDVLQELPPKTEITLQVSMSEGELALYEAQRLKALENIESKEEEAGQKHLRILAEIMKLRRLCCNPDLILPGCGIDSSKLRVFKDVLKELLDSNHKALVFSQFVDHLSIIRETLEEENISYRYLDGSTPMKKRRERINEFQNGEGDVFLISLKAGGAGLNLTAADYVIHMDPWWNPAVEDQASDRAHRIGQERPVTVYRLVTKDSIEERIVDLHKEKRDLASSLLSGSDMSGRISAEELLGLLNGKS